MTLGHLVVLGVAAIAIVIIVGLLAIVVVFSNANGLDDEERW